MTANKEFRVACVQMTSGNDLAPNVEAASTMIRAAAREGAAFVLTPENTTLIEPDRTRAYEKSFTEAQHPAIPAFAALARTLGIYLLIGSMPVRNGAKLANRSLLFDRQGNIAARYDKIHLFDVDLPDGERYRESNSIEPGQEAVLAPLPWGTLGMTICYDLRFPHLHRALAQAGADFISQPAAFTVPTGRAHWHVLLRARAIETGCFVFAPAQCGVHAEDRRTYGHSLIVSPWGEILADGGEAPGIITATIDPQKVKDARAMIPALRHDRSFRAPGSVGAFPQRPLADAG